MKLLSLKKTNSNNREYVALALTNTLALTNVRVFVVCDKIALTHTRGLLPVIPNNYRRILTTTHILAIFASKILSNAENLP